MPITAPEPCPPNQLIVAGVDVGGPKKGFHAVALRGTTVIAQMESRSASAIARWCADRAAVVVAVDAPCRWRTDGGAARLSERQLAKAGISCFSTPIETKAQGHSFYTWMVAGMELYAALRPTYPLYTGERPARCSIETFPQAIACALAGKIVSARTAEKSTVRRALLSSAGIPPTPFASLDAVDAALCALAARAFALGTFTAFGDAAGGFIITPAVSGVLLRPSATVGPKSGAEALARIRRLLPRLTPDERQQLAEELRGT